MSEEVKSDPPTKRLKTGTSTKANNSHRTGSEIIYLNIGGTHFDVSLSTVKRIPYFMHLWSGSDWSICKDRNDRVFVDRDGPPFADILTYLRTGRPSLSRLSLDDLSRLEVEADYYAMTELVQTIHDVEREEHSPGVCFDKSWVKCIKPSGTGGYWEVSECGDDDGFLIDYEHEHAFPGSFQMQESNTLLVLFHHDCVMPHMDNLKSNNDPLPHLYISNTGPAVDSTDQVKCIVRLGNIDIRSNAQLKEYGPAFCTHSGVDIVRFQKLDVVSTAVSVPKDYMNSKKNFRDFHKNRGVGRHLFHQLALIPIKFGDSPCRARLERVVSNEVTTTAKWSQMTNDGVASLSNDGTKVSLNRSGVYLVCSQVAVKYASDDEYPNGVRYREINAWGESVWLEQNHTSSTKFRKKLLTFHHRLDDNREFAPSRKENFQLGRLADILVCEKGDELSIKSERNVLLNNKKFPGDDYHQDFRLNPEFLDIMLLSKVEFRRFRSGEGDYGDYDENEFFWESIDDDHLGSTTRIDKPVFVQKELFREEFNFHVPEEEETMDVLVLATIPTLDFECYNGDRFDGHRIALRLDNEMQVISYISQDSGHYHHFNTVVRVKTNSKLDFCNCYMDSNNNETWTPFSLPNKVKILETHSASVTFIKIK